MTNKNLSDDKEKRGGVVASVRRTYNNIGAIAQCVTNKRLSDDKEKRVGVADLVRRTKSDISAIAQCDNRSPYDLVFAVLCCPAAFVSLKTQPCYAPKNVSPLLCHHSVVHRHDNASAEV